MHRKMSRFLAKGRDPSGGVETLAMKHFKLQASLATGGPVLPMVLLGFFPSRAQAPSAAAAHIQTYYQELMPTIRQAGQLTVRERDKRFAPAITAAFDFATMTRLAVGPAWKSFTAAQQAAVQGRSEERRVGEEGGCRGGSGRGRKKAV